MHRTMCKQAPFLWHTLQLIHFLNPCVHIPLKFRKKLRTPRYLAMIPDITLIGAIHYTSLGRSEWSYRFGSQEVLSTSAWDQSNAHLQMGLLIFHRWHFGKQPYCFLPTIRIKFWVWALIYDVLLGRNLSSET